MLGLGGNVTAGPEVAATGQGAWWATTPSSSRPRCWGWCWLVAMFTIATTLSSRRWAWPWGAVGRAPQPFGRHGLHNLPIGNHELSHLGSATTRPAEIRHKDGVVVLGMGWASAARTA